MANVKLKHLKFIVKIPIFHAEVLVMLGYSKINAIAELQKYEDTLKFINQLSKFKGYACAIDRKDGCVFIYMPELPTTPDLKALFEHERRHAVEMLLQRTGIRYKMNVSDEVYTYTQQYLAQCIFEELEKYGL